MTRETPRAQEDAEVSEEMNPWRRYRGNEPEHEVFGQKRDGARAVFPDALQGELERAVRSQAEPVLCDRRTRDVASEPLELATGLAPPLAPPPIRAFVMLSRRGSAARSRLSIRVTCACRPASTRIWTGRNTQ